jgi:hypothetical protein
MPDLLVNRATEIRVPHGCFGNATKRALASVA